MSANPEWLTVRQTAERLAVSEETVRRMIRSYELPASRKHGGARAPWVVNALVLERRLEAEARRKRLEGMGGGYGPQGRKAAVDAAAVHNDWTDEQRDAEERRLIDNAAREELAAQLYREMRGDGTLRQFEQMDDEARFEAEARELAARVRRAERLRERALRILEDEDKALKTLEDEDEDED